MRKVEDDISEASANRNAKNIEEQIKSFDLTDGSFSQLGMWKVKNKICPRPKDPHGKKRQAWKPNYCPKLFEEPIFEHIHREAAAQGD